MAKMGVVLAMSWLVSAQEADLYVGGLFDFRLTDRYQFDFVAQLINNKSDGFYDELLPGVTLQTRVLNSGCNSTMATTAMWSLAQAWGQPLHGVIGARCSSASMDVATLTRLQQIPQISARSTNPGLSDTVKYSHFYRVCAPDDRIASSLSELVTEFGFSRVGVITTSKTYAVGIADYFVEVFQSANRAAITNARVPACRIQSTEDESIADEAVQACFDELTALPIDERPVALLLSAHSHDAQQILSYASRSQFRPRGSRGDFVWFGTDGWTGHDSVLLEPSMEEYGPRVIGLKPATLTEEDIYVQYLARWQAQQRADGMAEEDVDVDLCPYCAETVDATIALTMALDAAWSSGSSVEERRANVANGRLVLEYLSNVSFVGLSGPVSFDENGEKAVAQYDIEVVGIQPLSATEQAPVEWTRFGRLGETLQVQGNYGSITALREDGQIPSDSLPGCETGADCKNKVDSDGNDTPHCLMGSHDTGECVRVITNGKCSARPTYGDGADYLSLFGPEATQCAQENAGGGAKRLKCFDAGTKNENKLASKCANLGNQFLPVGQGRTSGTFDTCCRADDQEMTEWALKRWHQYEIQFGQCDNCLRMLQKLICQVSCDWNNWRFFTGGSAMMQLPHTGDTREDAGVCIDYCSDVYRACRLVKWEDEVRYLYPDPTQFCTEVLNLQVGTTWTKAMVDQPKGSDKARLCVPDTNQADTHCVGEGAHQAVGFASTILCAVFVLAELVSSWTPKGTSRWVPPATVTLGCGFLLGVFIKHVVEPLEEIHFGSHNVIDLAQFNTDIFVFLLLPIIIFSSAFNMEHHASVFFLLYIRRITAFAVLGTSGAIVFTGGLTFAINGSLGDWELSFSESMMFGSLISAVDPVATLAALAAVGVDPRVYSLIYGESILNDAVAIVLFSVFKGVAAGADGEAVSDTDVWPTAVQRFFVMGLGSLSVGLVWGVLVSLLYKIYGVNPPPGTSMGASKMSDVTHRASTREMTTLEGHDSTHHAMADSAVFLIASLSSYYVAEAIHVSGIISALVCGLMCNQFAVRNMSFEAREYCHAFYVVLAEVADHLLMVWVGVLYYFSLGDFNAYFSIVAFGMVMASRILSVCGVAQLISCVGGKVHWKSQVMMIGAGLRGAVALALVKQMPTSASDEISSATLFIIFWSNVLLGGATTPLVSRLNIMNEADGSLDLGSFAFEEDELKYLHSIDDAFGTLAKYLLVNGNNNVDNANNFSRKGEKKADWQQVFDSARTLSNEIEEVDSTDNPVIGET